VINHKNVFSIHQYNIKKKEEITEEQQAAAVPDNPLMRKKKTPEELAREAEAEDEDEFTSELSPKNIVFINKYLTIWQRIEIKSIIFISELKNTLESHVTEIKTQIESKCSLQWFSNPSIFQSFSYTS